MGANIHATKQGGVMGPAGNRKGSQSGKRKSVRRAPGHKAREIAEQIDFCREKLTKCWTTVQIHKALTEQWGLKYETAHNRIKAAREAIRDDVNKIDRQELAAMLHDMATEIAREARETKQLSNAIGSIRLLGELAGLTGNNRL